MTDQIPRKIPPERPVWTDHWDVKYVEGPNPGFLTGFRTVERSAVKSAPGDQQNAVDLCMADIISQTKHWGAGFGTNWIVIEDFETSPDPTIGLSISESEYRIEIQANNPEILWPFVADVRVPLDWNGLDVQYPLTFSAGFGNTQSSIEWYAPYVDLLPPPVWEPIITLKITTNYASPAWVPVGYPVQQIYLEPQITVDLFYFEISSQEDWDYFFDEDAEDIDAILEEDDAELAPVSSPVFPLKREGEY